MHKKIAVHVLLAAVGVTSLVAVIYLRPANPPKGVSLADENWPEYVAEDGSFSVAMPGKPVVSTKVGVSALAGKVSIRYATLELPEDRVHFITYHHPIPPAVKTDDVEALLDSIAKSYVRQTRTAVIASRRINQGGAEGVAMLLFSPATGEINRQVVRFYVSKGHAYFAIVATNDELEGQGFVARFMETFRLLK